jgi:hypothetical protein
MVEKSVYYIPEDQDKWFGKVEEIADIFWKKGVFLATPNKHIYARLQEFQEKGLSIPEWDHDFGFVEMGVADEGREVSIESEAGEFSARIYLWVADIDEEDWDSQFKITVESVLGPCKEVFAFE